MVRKLGNGGITGYLVLAVKYATMSAPSRTLENPNPRHEPECDTDHSLTHFKRLTMAAVIRKIRQTRVWQVRCDCGLTGGLTGIVLALPLLTVLWGGHPASAQDLAVSTSSTTVFVFADRPMRDAQWTALFADLRSGVKDGDEETQAITGAAEIMRGDAVQPGIRVDTAIVVYLHGNCNLEPLVNRTAYAVPLGWVRRDHGRIEPFAHVDCTQIGHVLGPQARGMKREQRVQLMAGAIARVVMHEWIHIATQSSAHAERGVAKAQFGVADLMAGGR